MPAEEERPRNRERNDQRRQHRQRRLARDKVVYLQAAILDRKLQRRQRHVLPDVLHGHLIGADPELCFEPVPGFAPVRYTADERV